MTCFSLSVSVWLLMFCLTCISALPVMPSFVSSSCVMQLDGLSGEPLTLAGFNLRLVKRLRVPSVSFSIVGDVASISSF